MQFFRNHAKPVCNIMAACLLILSTYIPSAQAGMVDTVALLNAGQDRARVETFFARQDVQEQLVSLGVDPVQANLRAANLTDREAHAMAERIDTMPAGGSVGGAIVFVFLVLLLTDLFGLTDVFPFVNK